jgi:hypothetical protein
LIWGLNALTSTKVYSFMHTRDLISMLLAFALVATFALTPVGMREAAALEADPHGFRTCG